MWIGVDCGLRWDGYILRWDGYIFQWVDIYCGGMDKYEYEY